MPTAPPNRSQEGLISDPTADVSALPQLQIAIGVALCIASAVFLAVGLHLWFASNQRECHQPLLRRWRWWLGFLFATVLVLLSDGVSYALLPLALIVPLSVLPIFVSVILTASGCSGQDEALEPPDYWATFAMTAGATCVACVAVSTGEQVSPLGELRSIMMPPSTWVLVAIVALCDVAWVVLPRFAPATHDAWLTGAAGTIASALLAACSGGVSDVVVGCASDLVRAALLGGRALHDARLSDWAAGVGAVALLLLFGTLQLLVLQQLLARGRSVGLAVPAYVALHVLVHVGVGAGVLRELEVHRTVLSTALCAAGVSLVVAGLALLAHRHDERRRTRKQQVPDLDQPAPSTAA